METVRAGRIDFAVERVEKCERVESLSRRKGKMRRKNLAPAFHSFLFNVFGRVFSVGALLFCAVLGNAALLNVSPFSNFRELGSAGTVFAQDGPLDLSVLADPSASTVSNAATPSVGSDSSDSNAFDESDSATSASVASAAASPVSSESGSTDATSATQNRTKFWDLILAGGWIGAILLAASILAVSLAIRLFLALRRSVFAPPELENALAGALERTDFRAASQQLDGDASFLGRVVAAGLRETDRGWSAVEKGLEDAFAEETAALYRKTEPLATIGNVAPMLGLLGTVVGMVATFGELAVADAGGRNLAGGIYFALVTTVDGLIVAIPVLVVHSILNARIASLAADAAVRIDRIFAPAKRRLESRRPAAPPTTLSNTPPTVAVPSATPGLQEIPTRPALSLKTKRSE